MNVYDHKKIEKKWQKIWNANKLYQVKDREKKPKCYVLDMFPYPSGEGLHVGHPKGYIATDVYSRFKRMNGFNVLHPMGWDAFGLPAENYAITNKVHPSTAVKKNVARFKSQLEKIGFTFDWSREINTTDPAFYRWTQWIFLKLYAQGLAYQSFEPINWCPKDQTGLANEDVEDGKCERCGTPVEKKPMRQWVLKITDYADRMLTDLPKLHWPNSIIESQRNWIGRSEGAEITFPLRMIPGQVNDKHKVTVFTTRPDTLFGATFLAVSPELGKKWIDVGWKANEEVQKFITDELSRRGSEKYTGESEKRGVDAGIVAVNPVTNEHIPVWIVNYVLGDVGTGAIMAVPAHDERDFAFAKKFALPIRTVIEPETGENLPNEELRKSIVAIVENPETGKFLTLNWGPKLGGSLFIGGGREEGESSEATARREIQEETGYTDIECISETEQMHHHYFAFSKNVARNISVTGLHFKLRSETKIPQTLQDDEKENFSVEWVNKSTILQKMEDENHLLCFRRLILGEIYSGDGILMNSGKFTGIKSIEAKWKITEAVGGRRTSTYKLKDWVFSRQRYWGEPIPVVHAEDGKVYPVDEEDLPVLLPKVKSYAPSGTGESPLSTIAKWINVKGYITKHGTFRAVTSRHKAPKTAKVGFYTRETNTMPQWAGSSWYYLRYLDPKNPKALVDKKKEQYWQPVDLYVGGAEHATRHLIYARFWHKFLFDLGVVSTDEPFLRLQHVGLINASDGRKMSKRYGNVVNPDDVVELYGADTLRVYEMFMGPFDQAIAWSTDNMIGARRFLERVDRLKKRVEMKGVLSLESERVFHFTVKKVGEDIESFSFNTAISQMMILLNVFEKEEKIPQKIFCDFLKILSPFAPHLTEELWKEVNMKNSIHTSSWPRYALDKIISDTVTIAVQVAGKVRGTITVNHHASEEDVLSLAKKNEQIRKWLGEKELKRVIYVPGKIINLIPGI